MQSDAFSPVPVVDEIFDDAMVNWSPVFGLPPVTDGLIKVRLLLALLTGESVIVPFTLAIDHKPFSRILLDPSWCRLLFSTQSVSIARESGKTFSDMHRECGFGTALRPGTWMSTNMQYCDALEEERRYGSPASALAKYDAEFPHVPVISEMLDSYEREWPWVASSAAPTNYQDALDMALDDLVRNPTIRQQFRQEVLQQYQTESRVTRKIALSIVDSMERYGLSPTDAVDLRRASILAKSYEIQRSIDGETMSARFCGERTDAEKQGIFRVVHDDEVPVVGSLLRSELTLDALHSLSQSDVFDSLRARIAYARRFEPNALGSSMIEMFHHAGDVLGPLTRGLISTIKYVPETLEGSGVALAAAGSLEIPRRTFNIMLGGFLTSLGLVLNDPIEEFPDWYYSWRIRRELRKASGV